MNNTSKIYSNYINICEKNGSYYYPKNNELFLDNLFIKCCCIPEGYYLYKNDSFLITELCYSTCKICEKGGNLINHNCIECKENYKFELSDSEYINCYISNEIESYNNKSNINYIKEILLNNFERLDKLYGEDIEIKIENIIMTLTTTEIQKNPLNKNKTSIDFSKCEEKLKQTNNIPFDAALYMIKYEMKEEGMKIPKIEYEIYYKSSENKTIKLDLTICKDIKVDISIPISINDNLDKYNSSSDYYNDLCSKATSEFETDISLEDRRNEFIEKNMTLCEEDCNFVDYDYKNEIAKCSCNIKISLPFIDDVIFDKQKLFNKFKDVKNIVNLNLLKCYKQVFNKENLKKNIGFFIFSVIFILYFITLILFITKYYSSLKNQIKNIVEAKNVLSNLKKEKNNKITTNTNDQNDINNNNHNDRKIKKGKSYKKKRKKKKKMSIKSNILTPSIENNFKKSADLFQSDLLNSSNLMNNSKKSILDNASNKSKSDKNINYNKFKSIMEYNDSELNTLSYEKALIEDKRSYIQYYISLLRINHLLIFSFYCNNKDYNAQIIKAFLFFLFFAIHLTINALFFNENTLHKILKDKGEFNFVYQIPQIIYSSLISGILNLIIKFLALSEKNIIEIKRQKEIKNLNEKVEELYNTLKLKFTLFFLFTFVLLLFFMYYISCFCCIYEHTQIHLIEDSIISFGLSFIYPFGIYLIPGIFRIPSLRAEKKDKKFLYSLSLLLQNL